MRNIIMLAILILFPGCSFSKENREQVSKLDSTIVYASPDGMGTWIIEDNVFTVVSFSNQERDIELGTKVSYYNNDTSKCATLGPELELGVPDKFADGSEFKCNYIKGSIEHCYNETCDIFLVQASMIRGHPKIGIPVFYWYSRCSGILSISLEWKRDDRGKLISTFGSTLNLRSRQGLLAEGGVKQCDPNWGGG